MADISLTGSPSYEIRENPEEFTFEIGFDREPSVEVKAALSWLGMERDGESLAWRNMTCITRWHLEFVVGEAIAGRWATSWWNYAVRSGDGECRVVFGGKPPDAVLRRLHDFQVRYESRSNCGFYPEHGVGESWDGVGELRDIMRVVVRPYIGGPTDADWKRWHKITRQKLGIDEPWL